MSKRVPIPAVKDFTVQWGRQCYGGNAQGWDLIAIANVCEALTVCQGPAQLV